MEDSPHPPVWLDEEVEVLVAVYENDVQYKKGTDTLVVSATLAPRIDEEKVGVHPVVEVDAPVFNADLVDMSVDQDMLPLGKK